MANLDQMLRDGEDLLDSHGGYSNPFVKGVSLLDDDDQSDVGLVRLEELMARAKKVAEAASDSSDTTPLPRDVEGELAYVDTSSGSASAPKGDEASGGLALSDPRSDVPNTSDVFITPDEDAKSVPKDVATSQKGKEKEVLRWSDQVEDDVQEGSENERAIAPPLVAIGSVKSRFQRGGRRGPRGGGKYQPSGGRRQPDVGNVGVVDVPLPDPPLVRSEQRLEARVESLEKLVAVQQQKIDELVKALGNSKVEMRSMINAQLKRVGGPSIPPSSARGQVSGGIGSSSASPVIPFRSRAGSVQPPPNVIVSVAESGASTHSDQSSTRGLSQAALQRLLRRQ